MNIFGESHQNAEHCDTNTPLAPSHTNTYGSDGRYFPPHLQLRERGFHGSPRNLFQGSKSSRGSSSVWITPEKSEDRPCGFGGRDKKGGNIGDTLHPQSLSEQKLKDMSLGPDGPHKRGCLCPVWKSILLLKGVDLGFPGAEGETVGGQPGKGICLCQKNSR